MTTPALASLLWASLALTACGRWGYEPLSYGPDASVHDVVPLAGTDTPDADVLINAVDTRPSNEARADNLTADGSVSDLPKSPDAPLSGLAAICRAAVDCASGACVDGVCCETACAALCEACNVKGSVGFCVPVPGGQDPDNDCSPEAPGGCGNDGMCSGSRSCRKFVAGTVCEMASCTLAKATSVRLCDGQGACQPATTTSCGSYACNLAGTMCSASCTMNQGCNGGTPCNNGLCGTLLGNGALCASGYQCSSGTCADGVCCNRACAGTCEACNLASSVGTCAAVVDGQDPKSQCSDDGAASCGRDGVCNGAGACRFYASSTQCAPASCVAGAVTPARTCDGAGACQTARSSSCGAYACDLNANQCRTSCSSNADCAGGYTCPGGACVLSASATVLTGSYQGDGVDGRGISVGFRPEVLLVKSSGNTAAALKSSTMGPDVALLDASTSDPGLTSGVIRTLDVNGFTVAGHDNVNGAGVTYHWIAWAAGPVVKVGTYQGVGGSLAIGGLGLRPAWVWTIRADKAGTVERMPGHSQGYGMYGNVYNGSITSFDIDGFSLGSSGVCNTTGSLHHYVAWADAAGRSKMGSYVGDGTDGRPLLGLGFSPEVVFVQCVANPTQDLSFKTRSSGATLDQSFVVPNFTSVANVIQRFTADGFEVGSSKAANPMGGVCGYAAFAR